MAWRSVVRFGQVTLLVVFLIVSCELGYAADVGEQAEDYLDRIGVRRGICVLIGSGLVELAQEVAERSELIVYVQLTDGGEVDRARRAFDRAGLLGTRVYVERGDWFPLHMADNLADAVIADNGLPAPMGPFLDELLRVVRPLGKVAFPGETLTKPFPEKADDWTHAYHGPDNNPQSTDQLARAPYITQFLAGPFYVPFPEVTVTSQGRVFKAFGHVGYKERDWPWLNTLVAFNGYNGTLLWKRSLEEGFNVHRNTMVATPDVLYVADSKSCKLIDTATGEGAG